MKNVLIDIRDENEIIRRTFSNLDMVSVEDMLNEIENLLFEKDRLEEKIKDMEQDKEDNFKRVSISEQVGINDNDFI